MQEQTVKEKVEELQAEIARIEKMSAAGELEKLAPDVKEELLKTETEMRKMLEILKDEVGPDLSEVYEPWQVRVIEEQFGIVMKLEKLIQFLSTDTFKVLPLEDRSLLERQAEIMNAYSAVLGKRIARF
jgi:hypothetical protein